MWISAFPRQILERVQRWEGTMRMVRTSSLHLLSCLSRRRMTPPVQGKGEHLETLSCVRKGRLRLRIDPMELTSQ